MKKRGKMIAVLSAVVLCMNVWYLDIDAAVTADAGEWNIEHQLDAAECRQGDTVHLSVNLKRGSSSQDKQDIGVIEGVLEYDNSLFTVSESDIQPVESGKVIKQSFDKNTCVFRIEYDSDITASDGSALLQLALHVNHTATTGKTTVCITHLEWRSTAEAKMTETEHRVPSAITIGEAEEEVTLGDANLDNKINLVDVKYIMQFYNGTRKLNSSQQMNADVNQDGKVNLVDAKLIMQYYNGEIQSFQ